MTPPARSTDVASNRSQLERAGRIHWIHWLVLILSGCLTIFAWRFSSEEHEKRVEQRFEVQARQVTDLVVERMKKYEEALWGGVALIRTLGGEVSYPEWERYASSIQLETRYPGINGIGVIHALELGEVPDYLQAQRVIRPDFTIHPPHEESVSYPISYIIPVVGNEKAVGLDMAHETNRFTAAKQARDTGSAQITGPIVLVQDAQKTPGFLFYAPYYDEDEVVSVEARQEHFVGLVYAPFVMRKLLEGVLAQERREVGITISDDGSILYDENLPEEPFYDPDPLFEKEIRLNLYGREWLFNVRSASSFREVYDSNQPVTILIGGIIIDTLLLGLFIMLTRSARSALRYADNMTEEVERRAAELEVLNDELARSNRELDDFAHIASHDLKEPLRGIKNYSAFLLEDYEDALGEDGKAKLHTLGSLAQRLTNFIDDLHQISRVGREQMERASCDTGALVEDIVETLRPWLDSQQATVEIVPNMPTIECHDVYIGQVFRNLITNGVKYNDSEEKRIRVGWKVDAKRQVVFSVEDNGIGIPEKHHESVFRIFKRLHGRDKYGGGSGAGLTVAKKIVERHNGDLYIGKGADSGTVFYFTLNAENKG